MTVSAGSSGRGAETCRVARIAAAEDSPLALAEAARDAVKFARLFASRETAEDLRKRLSALCGQEV